MKNKLPQLFISFGIGITFVVAIFLLVKSFGRTEQQLKEAEVSYEFAETASTIAERQDGFNKALSIYNQLEIEYSPTAGNGKLYFNIANTYHQLSEYPLAVYYYLRAKELMPRSEKIDSNLETTFDKLQIAREKHTSIFDRIFFFHHRLSLPERLQVLTILMIIVFILCSWSIWKPFSGIKTLITIFGIAFLLMFGSIFYTQFISPTMGVVLKANQLHQDAGTQYSTVLDIPIPAGTPLTVLKVEKSGKWLKVVTDDGQMGYIPYNSIRLL